MSSIHLVAGDRESINALSGTRSIAVAGTRNSSGIVVQARTKLL